MRYFGQVAGGTIVIFCFLTLQHDRSPVPLVNSECLQKHVSLYPKIIVRERRDLVIGEAGMLSRSCASAKFCRSIEDQFRDTFLEFLFTRLNGSLEN